MAYEATLQVRGMGNHAPCAAASGALMRPFAQVLLRAARCCELRIQCGCAAASSLYQRMAYKTTHRIPPYAMR